MVKESKKERSSKPKKKQLTEQFEERWVGSRTEVFSRILAKESEIRAKTIDEKKKADRMIEDAKGKAGEIKRTAIMGEVGKDFYESEIAKAKDEAKEIKSSVDAEVEKIKTSGTANIDKAVDFIVGSVLPGNS